MTLNGIVVDKPSKKLESICHNHPPIKKSTLDKMAKSVESTMLMPVRPFLEMPPLPVDQSLMPMDSQQI